MKRERLLVDGVECLPCAFAPNLQKEGVSPLAVEQATYLDTVPGDDVERQVFADDDDPIAHGGQTLILGDDPGPREPG